MNENLFIQKWSNTIILGLSSAQFIISLLLTIPVWPATFLHKNGDQNGVIVSLDTETTLVSKL